MALSSIPVEALTPNRAIQIRSIPNPLDKSTIVSIFPAQIEEIKPTVQPSRFTIPPGSLEKPGILVVGPSIWWKNFMDGQPLTEMVVSSIQLADSIIKDYCNSLIGADSMGTMSPGLFFIPGEINVNEVKLKYKDKLNEVKARQDRWFLELTKMGDSLWAKSNHDPRVIWDMMRLAARSLNLNDKEWLRDYQTIEKVKCFACGSLKDPAYPVCMTCKIVDPNHPNAKDLKLVSVG